jgi:hypothetical protein
VKKIMGLQTTSIVYQNSSFRHDYLCHYLPLSAGTDAFSRSLLKFKRRSQPDLNAWIDCSLEVWKKIPLSPDTIILRALHHDETIIPTLTGPLTGNPNLTANPTLSGAATNLTGAGTPTASPATRTTFPTALDILGESLALHFNCRYLPSLLLKTHPTLSSKHLSREQRLAELRNTYQVSLSALASIPIAATLPPTSSPTPPPPPPFLLIDDILTTGTTMRMIIRALRRQFPQCTIRIFTLARSHYDPALNLSSPLHGSTYHLENSTGWIVAEEDLDGYATYSIETLKKMIFANSF